VFYIARPTLPKLEDFARRLEPVWESAWITNDGALHNELRGALIDHLGVEHLSLCCNATIALLLALQAERIDSGEVITTPFTFPATPHALHWNGVQPVFCDIEERRYALDPGRIEERIGPDTRAILPVQVFGHPCDVEAIQDVADRHGPNGVEDERRPSIPAGLDRMPDGRGIVVGSKRDVPNAGEATAVDQVVVASIARVSAPVRGVQHQRGSEHLACRYDVYRLGSSVNDGSSIPGRDARSQRELPTCGLDLPPPAQGSSKSPASCSCTSRATNSYPFHVAC